MSLLIVDLLLNSNNTYRVLVRESVWGQGDKDSLLPFENEAIPTANPAWSFDRRKTVLKALENPVFNPQYFHDPGEKEWMREEGLLAQISQHFKAII